MIGINNEGHVKVWSNSNFAENHPTHEKPVLQTTGNVEASMSGNSTEKEMVENVIEVIEERCEEGRYPADFRERIKRNSVTFDDAQDEI